MFNVVWTKMVDEIYAVIPGKQVIAQRLRENANQYFKKKDNLLWD